MTEALLLLVDLEGVCGVDSVDALVAGTSEHEDAQALLQDEIARVARAALGAGFSRVMVMDTHRSGSDERQVDPDRLPEGVTLLEGEDPCGPEGLNAASAIAALGMHAAAGEEGFAAHTVALHCRWTDASGASLSETDLVLGLAREAGVPALFVSGDDALERSLGETVAYVRTKLARSTTTSESRPRDEALAELEAAARAPASPWPRTIQLPITLTFKSRWQAARAVTAGAIQVADAAVEVKGESLRASWTRGVELVDVAGEPLADALRGEPGDPRFIEDVSALMKRGFGRAAHAVDLERVRAVYRSFCEQTAGESDESRGLRGLALHMLEAHAPATFEWLGAEDAFRDALRACEQVPLKFDLGLEPDTAMARVDAWYVLRQRGLQSASLPQSVLETYLEWLSGHGEVMYAWLLTELCRTHGARVGRRFDERPLREESRLWDLYWLTHLFLLDTRYCHRPLEGRGWDARIEEVLLATPWVIERGHVDLGAELAICLQMAGEARSSEHGALIEMLLAAVGPDGRVEDGSMEADADEMADHATAATLIALAGAAARA